MQNALVDLSAGYSSSSEAGRSLPKGYAPITVTAHFPEQYPRLIPGMGIVKNMMMRELENCVCKKKW